MGKYQRGALSLWWCATLVGIVAAIAFAGLFSAGSGRNLFAEGWGYVQNTSIAQVVRSKQAAAASVMKGQSAVLRKCKVHGAVVYSNVDCGDDNPTTRTVELHDNRGFELPKAPVAVAPQSAPSDTLQQKALDKAIEKATGNQAE